LPNKVFFVLEYLGNPGDFLLPLKNLFHQLITSSKFLDFCFISYQDFKQAQNLKNAFLYKDKSDQNLKLAYHFKIYRNKIKFLKFTVI